MYILGGYSTSSIKKKCLLLPSEVMNGVYISKDTFMLYTMINEFQIQTHLLHMLKDDCFIFFLPISTYQGM